MYKIDLFKVINHRFLGHVCLSIKIKNSVSILLYYFKVILTKSRSLWGHATRVYMKIYPKFRVSLHLACQPVSWPKDWVAKWSALRWEEWAEAKTEQVGPWLKDKICLLKCTSPANVALSLMRERNARPSRHDLVADYNIGGAKWGISILTLPLLLRSHGDPFWYTWRLWFIYVLDWCIIQLSQHNALLCYIFLIYILNKILWNLFVDWQDASHSLNDWQIAKS